MTTTTRLMTADELLTLPRGRFRYELIKGELITMSPGGGEHGAIIATLTVLFGQHVRANKLGIVFGAETGFKLESNPDTVRAPDVCFIRRERVEREGIAKGYPVGAPDLAVEVLSPDDSPRKVEKKKTGDWFGGGALEVWNVNPRKRTVTVHRSPTDAITLTEDDEIDGGELLPGFRCRVSEVFD
ncbi:MAG TPA: Uma2 family endonuclease [Pyrinomonadaceae bacterium]|nr:Uma2 family endonuclease [Pyrinomonadaceae bacterium]